MPRMRASVMPGRGSTTTRRDGRLGGGVTPTGGVEPLSTTMISQSEADGVWRASAASAREKILARGLRV